MKIKEIAKNGFNSIKSKINKGQERSVKAKKNILAAAFIKGTSIIISLMLVPMAINYVNASQYGIWLTLSSIIVWFSFFDIGLTQGLRNKFAAAVAEGKDELAQIYVSTTYALLTIICGFLWLIFLGANQFLDWSAILNVPPSMRGETSLLALMVFSYFSINFVLKIITTLLIANQQPALSNLISLLGQILSLILIFILVRTTEGSLIYLGAVFCFSPVVLLIIASLYFFNGSYKRYKPSFSKINFKYSKTLFNLGIIFFVIQIAGVIQYQTANFIIARNFGTADVTSYNIVFKYFGMLKMGFGIFMGPFWSASTEAFIKKDFTWIKKSVKKYRQLTLILFSLGIVMLIFSSSIYDLWLGKGKVDISFYLSLWGMLYFFASMTADLYVAFLNGINALRLQFIACLISPVVYLGVALLLINYITH